MKFRILILLLFAGLHGISQTNPDSLLIGSWQYSGYEMKKQFYSATPYTQYVSFYSDHVYQSSFVLLSSDTNHTDTTTEAGKWKFSEDRTSIGYLSRHKIPHPENLRMFDNWVEITSLNDTELVLGSYEGKIRIYQHYKKIKTQERIPDFYVAKPIVRINPSLRENAYLVNSLDSTKRIELKRYETIDFLYRETGTDASILSTDNTCSGYVHQITDSTIVIETWRHRKEISYSNGSTCEISKDYSDIPDTITIPLSSIYLVQYTNPARSRVSGFSAFLLSISTADMLLVAPLVGINYKTGGFNWQRYAIVSLAGLSGLAAGATLAIISSPKTYDITNAKEKTGKKLWYLK